MSAPGPALALIEIASLARAYVTLDALVKRAGVTVLWHRELTPGKSVILFGGEEEATLEAQAAALDASGVALLDDVLLPHAHPQLWQGLDGAYPARQGDAAAIVEVSTVASTLLALDAGLKAAAVTLVKLRLAAGIGGRGVFVLAGELGDAQAAAEAAAAAIQEERLLALEVVTRPHAEVWGFFSS